MVESDDSGVVFHRSRRFLNYCDAHMLTLIAADGAYLGDRLGHQPDAMHAPAVRLRRAGSPTSTTPNALARRG
jgi:hypothetical protein